MNFTDKELIEAINTNLLKRLNKLDHHNIENEVYKAIAVSLDLPNYPIHFFSLLDSLQSKFKTLLNLKARALLLENEKAKLLFFPCPEKFAFESSEAMIIVKKYFSVYSTDLAEYVNQLAESDRIHPGDFPYCKTFKETGITHIYLKMNGELNVSLQAAHEIGHAFHCDGVKSFQRSFSMCFAEAISICFESLVNDGLKADTKFRKIALWHELSVLCFDFLLQPGIFELEQNLLLMRAKQALDLDSIKSVERKVLNKWLDEFTPTGEFWRRTRSLSDSSIPSFESILYPLGWIFGLRLAELVKLNSKTSFELLRSFAEDSARITPNEIALKYFGVSLDSESFWIYAGKLVDNRLSEAQELFA